MCIGGDNVAEFFFNRSPSSKGNKRLNSQKAFLRSGFLFSLCSLCEMRLKIVLYEFGT